MIRVSTGALLLVLSGMALFTQPLPEIEYDGGARSHPFDLLHTTLDLRFDFEQEVVYGVATHRIRSLNPSLMDIELDAAPEIVIEQITVDESATTFEHKKDTLRIELLDQKAYNDTFNLQITYQVSPRKGLYFIKKEPEEPNGRDQIWTQGEGEDHHYWIPMYDYPNDLATSEVYAAVRSDWKLLSNGEFIGAIPNSDGTTTWHYKMEKPHAPYLMMLAAGDYLITHDTIDGLPLEYWTYPDMPDRVEPTFGRTPEIYRYLRDLIGVPYPWNKYSQIMINEFMYGGMENTTATTLNDFALVDEQGLVDYSPDGLIAHELAHQWFGNLVTNRSWDHLWIHESFATYLAARWIGYHQGQEVFEKQMYDYILGAYQTDRDRRKDPIASGSGVISNIYGRGAVVLHMLNQLLGEELFWSSVQLFLTRHAHSVVETNDLKLAFEDATGYNLSWFFQQWIYGGGMPVLEFSNSYDDGTYRIELEQVQEIDELTGHFSLRIPVEMFIREPDGITIAFDTLFLLGAHDFFEYRISEPITSILDASTTLLSISPLSFSREELVTIAEFASSPINRYSAVRRIETDVKLYKKDIARELKRIYYKERSDYVRGAIVTAVATLDKKIAAEMIPSALVDPTTTVRRAAIEASWVFNDEERISLLRPLLNDSSYTVVIDALEMLAATEADSLEEHLVRLQFIEGARESLARAWMQAVMVGKFTQFVDRVTWYARNASRGWTKITAFDVLAELETTTPDVRLAILNGMKADGEGVFKAALRAAEKLDDDELNRMLKEGLNGLEGERREMLEDIL